MQEPTPNTFEGNNVPQYPSPESAQQQLAERYGDGLTFNLVLSKEHPGYAQVIAYKAGQYVGEATMGLDPDVKSNPISGQNSGRYTWFIK